MKAKLCLVFIVAITGIRSQCKSFFKTKCLPSIAPYIFNGEAYSETFFDGDTLVMDFVFYSGMNYRLAMCVQPTLPRSYFEVKDRDGTVYFSSRSQADTSALFQFWDFKTNTTIPLKVVIYAIGDRKQHLDVVPSGCISIMTGFK